MTFLHLSDGICMDPTGAAASWLQNLNSVRRHPAKSLDQDTFAARCSASWQLGAHKSIFESGWKGPSCLWIVFLNPPLETMNGNLNQTRLNKGTWSFEPRQSLCSCLDLFFISANQWHPRERSFRREKIWEKVTLFARQRFGRILFPGRRSRAQRQKERVELLYKVLNARQRWSSLHAGAAASFHWAALTSFHDF